MREKVRCKIYDWGYGFEERIQDVGFASIANYSYPVYVDNIRKSDRARLAVLRDESTPCDVYIKDVGFKTLYKHSRSAEDKYVYVVEATPINSVYKRGIEGRETMRVRRVKASVLDALQEARWGGGPRDKVFRNYMANNVCSRVFKDRITRKEWDKIHLLNIMDEGQYAQGLGGWIYNTRWDYDSNQRVKTDERMYYVESN